MIQPGGFAGSANSFVFLFERTREFGIFAPEILSWRGSRNRDRESENNS
jgi:hypothetical protein